MLSIATVHMLRMICIAAIVLIVVYFWFFRIRRLVSGYFDVLCKLINCVPRKKYNIIPFYTKNEVEGFYQERMVVGGICYIGKKSEWMPLPFIKIKLKSVIRYNYSRLPNFAVIENDWLVLRIDESLPWGMLSKDYPHFFTEEYISIALSRLLAVAEDVERGRTMEEVFK